MFMLAVGLTAQTLHADVLDQVPADAAIVFKVKNLKAYSDKIAALANQWGIAALKPELSDPLAAMKKDAGVENGVSDDGDMAVYMMEVPTSGEEPTPVLLVPVSDYKGFIGNFADAQTEGGTTSFTNAKGEKMFSQERGKYAVLGMNADSLKKPEKVGVKMGEGASKELGDRDIVMFMNVAAMRPALQAKAEARETQVLGEIDQAKEQGGDKNAESAQAKMMPLVKAVFSQLSNVGRGFIDTADSATWGVNLTDKGISSGYALKFKPGSYAADVISKLKTSDKAMTNGMPTGDYLAVMGLNTNPDMLKKMADDFLTPIRAEIAKLGDDGKTFGDYVDALENYLASSTQWQTGVMATGADAAPGVDTVALITGDAKKIADAHKEMLGAQDAMYNALFASAVPAGDNTSKPASMNTSVTPDATTIEDVSFSHFESHFDPGEGGSSQQEMMARQLITSSNLGTQTGLFGVVDPQHFLVTAGSDDKVTPAAVKAIKSNDTALATDKRYTANAGELPKQKLGELYVSIDQLMKSGLAFMKANSGGPGVDINIPPDVEPFVFSLTTDADAGLRFDGYLPSQTIQTIVSAAIQVQMMMQGGGPGAQPGQNGAL